jgi:AraC-like DNA-binding protein
MIRTAENTFFRYLPIQKKDEKWGLYVTGAGSAVIIPGSQYPSPRSHPDFYDFSWTVGRTLPEFHLVFIVDGDGEFQFDRETVFRTPPGSVLLIPPGRWHRYRPSARLGWNEYWISFNGEIARHLVRSGFIAAQPELITEIATDETQAAFHRLFDRLMDEPLGMMQLISADLFELLTITIGTRPQGRFDAEVAAPPDAGDQLVTDAMAMIWGQGNESLSVKELVDKMLVARRTLERAFRKSLGHGVHEEILRCRLERTKRLLADRSLSIEEVARKAGFGNVRSLRRAFTCAEGMSPQSYRQLIFPEASHPQTFASSIQNDA